ncbi:hypothetical protein LPJ81_004823, partial [Coemansia sp. IMI 209127]
RARRSGPLPHGTGTRPCQCRCRPSCLSCALAPAGWPSLSPMRSRSKRRAGSTALSRRIWSWGLFRHSRSWVCCPSAWVRWCLPATCPPLPKLPQEALWCLPDANPRSAAWRSALRSARTCYRSSPSCRLLSTQSRGVAPILWYLGTSPARPCCGLAQCKSLLAGCPSALSWPSLRARRWLRSSGSTLRPQKPTSWR